MGFDLNFGAKYGLSLGFGGTAYVCKDNIVVQWGMMNILEA